MNHGEVICCVYLVVKCYLSKLWPWISTVQSEANTTEPNDSSDTEETQRCVIAVKFLQVYPSTSVLHKSKKTHQTEPPAWPSPLRFTAAWWSIGDDARKDFCLIECVGTFNEICPIQHLPAGVLHGETARHNDGRQSCLSPISYQTDEPVTEMRTARQTPERRFQFIYCKLVWFQHS